MKLPIGFITITSGSNVVLASTESKQLTLHFVDLPVNDYKDKRIERATYVCRAGSECVFCKQFKAFKEGRIEKDAHTSTAVFSVIPVYDLDDGKKLKMAEFALGKNRLLLDTALIQNRLLLKRVGSEFDIRYSLECVESIDRDTEELPLINDWTVGYGTMQILDVESSESIQDFQLHQLVRYDLCQYTIDYLEKRMEI